MVVGNDHKFDALQVILKVSRTNLVDHLLDGIVIAGSLGSHSLSLMTVVFNREMESTARMPLMKQNPNIMLCCLFEFVKFKLEISGLHQVHQWEIRKGWNALSVFCLRENDVRWKKATNVCYDAKIYAGIFVWNCCRGSICNCSAASLRHECYSRQRMGLAVEWK